MLATFCLHYTLSKGTTQQAPLLGRVKLLIYLYHWSPGCFYPVEDLLTCHITRGAFRVHALHSVFNHYDINVLRPAKFAERFTLRPGKVVSICNGVGISLLPPCRNALNMHKES